MASAYKMAACHKSVISPPDQLQYPCIVLYLFDLLATQSECIDCNITEHLIRQTQAELMKLLLNII